MRTLSFIVILACVGATDSCVSSTVQIVQNIHHIYNPGEVNCLKEFWLILKCNPDVVYLYL